MLGGGVGLAGRAYGLTLDRVRSFDVVTADGRRRRVTGDDDLFWALRGGGGHFGIVTAVRLAHASPRRRRRGFASPIPRASREEALAAWDALARAARADLDRHAHLRRGERVRPVPRLRGRAAPDRRAARRASRARASPPAPTPGSQLQRRWAGCADGGLPACLRFRRPRSTPRRSTSPSGCRAAGRAAFAQAADTGATLICDAYGGAINEVAAGATAFVHRTARFSVQILSYTDVPTARSRVNRGAPADRPVRQRAGLPELPGPRPARAAARVLRREPRAAAADQAHLRPRQSVQRLVARTAVP